MHPFSCFTAFSCLQASDSASGGERETLQAPLAAARLLPVRCGLWHLPEHPRDYWEHVARPPHQFFSWMRETGYQVGQNAAEMPQEWTVITSHCASEPNPTHNIANVFTTIDGSASIAHTDHGTSLRQWRLTQKIYSCSSGKTAPHSRMLRIYFISPHFILIQ